MQKYPIKDEKLKVLQTIDERNRLLPYLSGGSIGLGVAIWYLNHVSKHMMFQKELSLITNLYAIRSTLSGGLLEGAGGLLLIPPFSGKNQEAYEKTKDEVLELLNLFVIDNKDYSLFPGQFCYRLSDDIFSGSSGIILALMGIFKYNPLYWLPIINIDNFYSQTKYKYDKSSIVV